MKSPPGLLISFSGIDGSGKSTIAKKLRDYLYAEYGLPSRVPWCKFGLHPLSRLHLSSITRKSANQLWGKKKNYRPNNLNLQIYGRALLFLHLAHIYLAVRRSLQTGRILICDRYIFDTMVDLHHEFHYPIDRIPEVLPLEWLPKPDSKFLLDLPAKVAYQRKPDSESEDFLRQRRFLYKRVAKEFDLHVIDACQAPDMVLDQVVSTIDKPYG